MTPHKRGYQTRLKAAGPPDEPWGIRLSKQGHWHAGGLAPRPYMFGQLHLQYPFELKWGSRCVEPGPAASPRNSLEMQILRLFPTNWIRNSGVDPPILDLTSLQEILVPANVGESMNWKMERKKKKALLHLVSLVWAEGRPGNITW